MLKLIFVITFISSFALGQTRVPTSNSNSDYSRQWRRGTATVLFAGVGGGILGLSTLSFYGNPQEHAGNVTLGGLLGVLGGLWYVISEDTSGQNQTANTVYPVIDIDKNTGPQFGLQAQFKF